jgi:hypothetical protein
MQIDLSSRPVCPNPRCGETGSMVAVRVEAGAVTKWCCFVCGEQVTVERGKAA